jgi:hypothetical protein
LPDFSKTKNVTWLATRTSEQVSGRCGRCDTCDAALRNERTSRLRSLPRPVCDTMIMAVDGWDGPGRHALLHYSRNTHSPTGAAAASARMGIRLAPLRRPLAARRSGTGVSARARARACRLCARACSVSVACGHDLALRGVAHEAHDCAQAQRREQQRARVSPNTRTRRHAWRVSHCARVLPLASAQPKSARAHARNRPARSLARSLGRALEAPRKQA